MSVERPYGHGDEATSGWSGSSTSRERAEQEDASGITGWRAKAVLAFLRERGALGATDPEVQDHFHIGHGASSGTLTRLHKAGVVARLAERRVRNEVYVAVEHAHDRETVPYRPQRGRAIEVTDADIERLALALASTDHWGQKEALVGWLEDMGITVRGG